jgi:hypothetical protein
MQIKFFPSLFGDNNDVFILQYRSSVTTPTNSQELSLIFWTVVSPVPVAWNG